MLMNQGEAELDEGLKAKKTVKTTKANMNPYIKTAVLLVLRMGKRILKSEIKLPSAMRMYFLASAMEEGFSCFCVFCLRP